MWLQRGPTHGRAEAGDVAPEPKGKKRQTLEYTNTYLIGYSCCKLLHLEIKSWLYNSKKLLIIVLNWLLTCFLSFWMRAAYSPGPGPPHVYVYELQHSRSRRHGGDLQPDQDPAQT